MVLETDRLVLDQWRISDWIELRPIATDAEVMLYITGGVPWVDDQIKSFVEHQVKLYVERGYCRRKLLAKPTLEMVSFCGLGLWRDAPDPEIGWWLARRYWGHGLATEAARIVLQDAFERVRLNRIISITMSANTASIRIMEKLGLWFEREVERDGLCLLRYGIDRTQFIASHDRRNFEPQSNLRSRN